MKIAICGAGPAALEMSLELSDLGASVTLFSHQRMAESFLCLAEAFAQRTMCASWRLLIPATYYHFVKSSLDDVPTYGDYQKLYLNPLIQLCREKILLKPHKVLRIQKRFLAPHEEVPGRVRLADLFRVIYEVNPEKTLQQQMTNNPALFKSMHTDILCSLKQNIENYEDFDIVVDATDILSNPLPLGASHGHALNETLLRGAAKISYGIQEICRDWSEILKEKELIVVGSGETAGLVLAELAVWLKNDNHKLYFVTTDIRPFLQAQEDIQQVLKHAEAHWQEQRTQFESALRNWQLLEDYEKAKIPRPAMPVPKIKFFPGYNITSLDKMIDTEGVYITIERADFRFGEARREKDDLKTLPAKRIIVATGYSLNYHLYTGLRVAWDTRLNGSLDGHGLHPEPGLYTHSQVNPTEVFNPSQGSERNATIKQNILSFFTKVEGC